MCSKTDEISLKEKWENATIANNFIFYKVMHNNPDVCKELLEILLEIKIDHIDMRQEEEVQIETDKHKVLLDLGQTDSAIQNANILGVDLKAVDTAIREYYGIKEVKKNEKA